MRIADNNHNNRADANTDIANNRVHIRIFTLMAPSQLSHNAC
jgi:hypothetical protein